MLEHANTRVGCTQVNTNSWCFCHLESEKQVKIINQLTKHTKEITRETDYYQQPSTS
jgi:hypothetical protein